MPRNKPRLHLALYARPKHPDAPHYALLICPKNIPTLTLPSTNPPSSSSSSQAPLIHKHHVKNTLQIATDCNGAVAAAAADAAAVTQPWVYEHARLASLHADPQLLLTVIIGKLIESVDAVAAILASVPVCRNGGLDGEGDGTQGFDFDCVEWVRRAVGLLRERGAVSGMEEWEGLRERAMAFLRREREAGRWVARGVREGDGKGVEDGERRVPVLEWVGGVERVVLV
ncbi:hypothetical protein IWX49DRAFT_35949 [Phyllosticta citricarpa]